MTNDHYPRIRAQQQAATENAAMAELERRTAPLFWLVYLAAFAVVMASVVDGWQDWAAERAAQAAHTAARMADLAADSEAFAQCLNGKAIGLGDAVLRCEVRHYDLVAGIKGDAQ